MTISFKNIPKFQYGGNKWGNSGVMWTDPNSTWYTRSGENIIAGTFNYLKSLKDKWELSGSKEDYNNFANAVATMNNDQRYDYAPNHMRFLTGNYQEFRGNEVGNWQTKVKNLYNYINEALGQNYASYSPILVSEESLNYWYEYKFELLIKNKSRYCCICFIMIIFLSSCK